MKRKTPLVYLLAILCLIESAFPVLSEEGHELPPAVSNDEVKSAATRAVRLVERTSGEFLKRKKCFTCHTQTLSVMVLRSARQVGIPIDEQNFKLQTDRVSELDDGSLEGMRVDTVGHGLWTLNLGKYPADDRTGRMTAYLLNYQKDLGHWKVTVDRPPAEASDFTTNYVAVRALKRYGTDDQQEEISARMAAVKRWIATANAVETEDLAFRLRLAVELDLVATERDSFAKELLKRQKPAGGWAQKAGMDPDAYATGSALAALHEAGSVSRDHPAWRRGLTYLLRTQTADGSWHVATRAKPIQEYFESGFPHGKDQFVSAFATGWATEALLISLRERADDRKPTKEGEQGAADQEPVRPKSKP